MLVIDSLILRRAFMADSHKFKGHQSGSGDVWSDDDGGGITSDNLGWPSSIPSFISLVDAILVTPPREELTAGRNGPTDAASSLYWTYSREDGLNLAAKSGFMTTATGDGGFSLTVRPNGEWQLKFDGTDKMIGSERHHDSSSVPPPPAGNTVVNLDTFNLVTLHKPSADVATSYNASAGHMTVNGGIGWDTISGGVGDYIIGGSGTLGAGLAGGGGAAAQGNCAVYSSSTASILVDMQNGFGYGGNAEGNVYVNINQVRGSSGPNVLIGNSNGTDLKSGGNNSVLISTGGSGFEMRPDGYGNVLVSTSGADRVVFDASHGWLLGDQNIMLGFSTNHGDTLDLRLLLSGATIKEVGGVTVTSNFLSSSAVGFDLSTGMGDIANYLKIVDRADGDHVMFSATGNVASGGTDIMMLSMVHGLTTQSLEASHSLLLK
jgi:hypothetical protein